MNKIMHLDTSYSTITPYNLTGNFLYHINELGEWDRQFILYDWGTRKDRTASVEWLDDDRKILSFEHLRPVDLNAGRIQIQTPLAPSPRHEEYKRMRINFDTPGGWLVAGEWWSGADWLGDDYSCRISMGLGPNGLVFYMDTRQPDGLWRNHWASDVITVPISEWFDLYIRIIAGDGDTGAFQVALREPGSKWDRVVDIQDYTYNPDSPELMYPNFCNPAMLYTGASTTEQITASGQPFRVDWRMIEMWSEEI